MNTLDFLKSSVGEEDRDEFERSLLLENFRRGKILAVIVIAFETVYCAILIVSSLLSVDSRFRFSSYLALYLAMIAVNAGYLLYNHYFRRNSKTPDKSGLLKVVLIIYIAFMMTWGSVVALMDQKLYGQIVAYIINTIICSVVFMLDLRSTLIPFGVSTLVLMVGLPFFQPSGDILIGHYVNLAVFIVICLLASRLLFSSYCKSFNNTILLSRSKTLLENEIEENRKITLLLSQVNLQLKALTLQDELTGIPNRRSFRDFVDRTFEQNPDGLSTLSVIMIDIDFFKQFNDCYGHDEGDIALRAIAGEINSIANPPFEFAVRWGGEEFVYAAFNTAPEIIADRARSIALKVSALGIAHRLSPVSNCITVSLGISTIRVLSKNDIHRAVGLADETLYQAKSCGRNCAKFLDDGSEFRYVRDDRVSAPDRKNRS